MILGEQGFWWLIGILGIAASALCSGLETGMYSVSRVRLQVRAHHGSHQANILRRLLTQRAATLGTLLIGNNIAQDMVSASLTVITSSWSFTDIQLVVFNILIITPIIMVLCEIVPKDFFAAHADRVIYPFAVPLYWFSRLLRWTGVLWLIDALAALFGRMSAPQDQAMAHPRYQIGIMVKEGVGHGALTDEQSAMVERVLDLGDRRIAEEMTPWNRVTRVGADDAPAALWAMAERNQFSRLPVTDAAGKVVGVVSLYDALRHRAETCPPIRQVMKPPMLLRHDLPIREALTRMRSEHVALAVVVARDRPVGIVTIKDLVEPITGELMNW